MSEHTTTTPNAPTAREAGEQNVAIACEKGCRYLGFADAVNHCPYCELGKAGDALAEALTRAQAAESALLAARREVEAARPAREWRCFHCDYVATNEEEAARHFGQPLDFVHDQIELFQLRDQLARLHAKLKEASNLFVTLREEPHFSTTELDDLVALAALAATQEPR